MSNENEWGIAQVGAAQAATTPMAQTTKAAIGAGVGAVAGGLLGNMVKHPIAGAVVGGVAGGAAGYYVGAPPAGTATSKCVSSPATLPQGGYNQVATAVQGGVSVKLLAPGGLYLLSIPMPAGSDPTAMATQLSSELTALNVTNNGVWSCTPPVGWPAGDPNAASGVFMSVAVPNNVPVSIPVPAVPGLTVWATNGNTA